MDKMFVKDKQHGEWIFYINEESELCYGKDGKEQILQDDLRKSFDIALDISGNFHLTTQTNTGNLIYLTYDYNSWRKFTVLDSKSPDGVMRGFKLMEICGTLNSFYILDFKGRNMLVHHIYDMTGTPPSPKVIEYAAKGSEVRICGDRDGNIHIFFTGIEGNTEYKIYSPKTKKYAEGSINTEDDIKNIYPVCAEDGVMHFLYTARLKSYYALVYLSSDSGERKVISFGDANVTDMCMLIRENDIHIQWKERGVYYQCVSSDGGDTFKKPAVINQIKGKSIELVKTRLAGNPMGFGGDCRAAYCKGGEIEFAGGIKKENIISNHKNNIDAYNNRDGLSVGETHLAEKVARQEREIIRLGTALQSLTDKVAYLAKGLANNPHPTPKNNIAPSSDNKSIIEVNDEKVKAFEDTCIENVDFENSKKF